MPRTNLTALKVKVQDLTEYKKLITSKKVLILNAKEEFSHPFTNVDLLIHTQ
jgi:hypothetical protein